MRTIKTYEVKVGTGGVEMPRGARVLTALVRMEPVPHAEKPNEVVGYRQAVCVHAVVDPTLPMTVRKVVALMVPPGAEPPLLDDDIDSYAFVGRVEIGPFAVFVFDGGEVVGAGGTP